MHQVEPTWGIQMPIDPDRKRKYLGVLITSISIYTSFCFIIIVQLIFWEEVKNPLVQLALFFFILCFLMFLCGIEIYMSRYLELCFSPILPIRKRLLLLADGLYLGGVFLWSLSISLLLFAADLIYLGWFLLVISMVIIPILYVIVWRDLVRKVYSELEKGIKESKEPS